VSILQNGFDPSGLTFTDEYYDVLGLEPPAEPTPPPWQVYYDGGFWGHSRDCSRPGREVPVQCRFHWANGDWYVPSVYLCGKGLVADICRSASAAELQTFIDKWDLLKNDGRDVFTPEQREQMERENPLGFDYHAAVTVNGRLLRQKHGSGIGWNPCVPDRNSTEIRWVMHHYGLDPTLGWSIRRMSFPWDTKRAPKLRSLSLTLTADQTDYSAGRFTVSAVGQQHTVVHPVSGEIFTLTVHSLEQGQMDESVFRREDMEFPLCYTAMEYTTQPPADMSRLQVRDCSQGDSPRSKEPGSSVVGGSVGVVVMRRTEDAVQGTVSSLTFAPRDTVEWRVIFHETEHEPITVDLL